jgi:hypothetical protein
MRRWLARLPFTFLILAGWLAYEGYRASTGFYGPVGSLRVATYFLAAIFALSLSMMGFRERHRPRESDDRLPPL